MADLSHFKSIPWCASHLSTPNLVTDTSDCRYEKRQAGDRLFARTLNTPDTITSFLVFYPRPSHADERITNLKAFLSLEPGLNGFAGICHGGIVMMILDEVIGQLIGENQKRGTIPHPMLMTRYLNTRFLRPVVTPSTILVTSTISNVEGRKYSFEAAIEDQDGNRLAECDALFIAVKGKL